MVVLYLPLPGMSVRQVLERLRDAGLPNLWVPDERDFIAVPSCRCWAAASSTCRASRSWRWSARRGGQGVSDLTRCRVVLVRPEIAANLGAAARAMRNIGLRDLVLVDPGRRHRTTARPTAWRRIARRSSTLPASCRRSTKRSPTACWSSAPRHGSGGCTATSRSARRTRSYPARHRARAGAERRWYSARSRAG